MKKKSSAIAFILLLFVGFSQTASQQLSNTLLWKISGNNITSPSYIFGTMHILCAEDATLSDSLKTVIKNCNEIYFEIDMTDMKGKNYQTC